jgi:hypothetical protein
MTHAMDWLIAHAPGFNMLSQEEQDAITDFSLLWGLFEARILDKNGSVRAICEAVQRWHDSRRLQPDLYDAELAYFKNRYHHRGHFTHHFDGLLLRRPDRSSMVKAVLDGTDADPCHRASTALIIVFRYRNNLFHGEKWEYALADQLGNFTNANQILMKTLECYGGLA